jgi:SPP1 family predicted phage head-tail adaptor
MVNTVKLWRYREKVILGDPNGKVQTRPGRYISKFVPKITLKAAPYRLSERYISSIQGTDFQNTVVLAVRHRPDIDYESYQALYKGKYYSVSYVTPDESNLVTYDLISLKLIEKNGNTFNIQNDSEGGS